MAQQEVDEGVRKEIWTGMIPVCITLAKNEVATQKPPVPYYCMIPRCTYYPLLMKEVKEHFLPATVQRVDEAWLSYRGEPLRWNRFFGVLFDLFGNDSLELPWTLVVHFQGYPADKLFKRPTEETVKTHFFQSVKEANFLKFGTGSEMSSALLPDEQTQLWQSVVDCSYARFWEVNTKLAPKQFSAIPVRILQPNSPFIQFPFCESDANGEPYTLLSLLQEALPDIFNNQNESPDRYPKVVVQGICPPFNTPIVWLCSHCAHPDNFLYICIL
mmetsp:Transcript_2496/g.6969  ORF Transcript_2496/g.6969 Transcript_2496/m.6969 type:complete len:272 (+) Transcript_2496:43-858(+)